MTIPKQSREELQYNVPQFLTKLWNMVDSPQEISVNSESLISWNNEGNGFVISDPNKLSLAVLPFYFKHSNLASFVRQLNMYGFKKMVPADAGALVNNGRPQTIEFAHQFFLRHNKHLLENIKRKTPKGHQLRDAVFV